MSSVQIPVYKDETTKMTVGDYFGLDENLEVLIINLYLMLNLLAEPCVFNIYSNLRLVDTIKCENTMIDLILKLLISLIIVVKCSASYIMLGCQIMSLYPIFYSDLADLLLPLVIVCIFRNIMLNSLELLIGIILCSRYLIPITPCTIFIIKFTFLIFASCYYVFTVMKFYSVLMYSNSDEEQPRLIDNEDIVMHKRVRNLNSHKLKFSLLDFETVGRMYSSLSLINNTASTEDYSEIGTFETESDLILLSEYNLSK